MIHTVGIGDLPYTTGLDHKPIFLHLITEKQCSWGRSFYKLNNSLIQTTELRQAVLQVCLSHNPETQSFPDLTNSLSRATAVVARQLAAKRKRREQELQQAIRIAEQNLIRHAGTDVYARILEEARSEVGEWERWRTRGLQLRARVKEWEDGERMMKFLFQKIKNRCRNASIEKLEGPQGPTTSTKGMVAVAQEFYSNLYKSREDEHPRQQVERARSKFLVYLEPTISQSQAAKLDAPLLQEELLEALKSLAPNKNPGKDGLTSEFWLEFWPILGREYEAFLEQAWQREGLGHDPAIGIVTLLYKKGNPADIRNYRPITLLTLTHKIVAKALANRLRGITDGCFHLDQTGFIPGRFILDNVMTLTESVRYIRDKKINAAILFFDFEKAYDQVTLHNQALMNIDTDPTGGFRKLNFLLQSPPFPPETFGNLLLLYCKPSHGFYDLAADVMAENTHLTYQNLSQDLYEYLDATILRQTSPEEAYRKYDELATRHVDILRRLTKVIQDARIARDNEAIKKAITDYDEALENYIPVLMAMAKIYWDMENYTAVERIFRQSAEFCSEHDVWKLNVAHTFFMQDTRYKEAIRYYEPIVKKHSDDILGIPAIVLANLCVSYIMTSQNEDAEELMRKIEKEEERAQYQDPEKQCFHLCIVNLVIGTLYCAKQNFEFGISRVIKSLEPYNKKIETDTWFYAKRCFLALIENLAKHMIVVKDATFSEVLAFLDAADLHGKSVMTNFGGASNLVDTYGSATASAAGQPTPPPPGRSVSQESRALKRMVLRLRD
ncbi:hypothetical protein CBR_g38718 [Chara braunii]|uniref:Reverse transcriptase domain-containing protein n=1 Tax=Chara braunii TaxID=69332 RepID=A0A388LQE1_CHABU|nr:hypothetical protein CBR_g38718 [Chara braunii]|eukprot:GBG84433.1 hypothetical protein CBR_g38718 [Chara braunii]